nr:hypothetical protein [uncultured bacterium]
MLSLQPDSVPALTALGRLQLLDHNDAEAIRLLERALRGNPSDAESTYQLGVLYDRNGRSEEAIKLLRRAITLRANYPDPHYHLGRIALEHKDYRAALAELELARKLLPDQEAIRMRSAALTRPSAAPPKPKRSSMKSAASRPPSSNATASVSNPMR